MRFYKLLLHFFPTSFRNEYGEEMCWIFSKKLRDASTLPARILLWIATFWEIITNASRAHFDILKQDLRYTARTLRRTPGFTFAAIVIAALGIGATTGAFSIADHVLIRPLPFPEWQRMVKVWGTAEGYSRIEASPPDYRDWKRLSTSFESMGVFTKISANFVGNGDPQRIEGLFVSSDVLRTLSVQPILGRLFTDQDDTAEAPATLILSYGLWQTRFNGDPGVLGKKVLLDNEPHEIIGVMPRTFYFSGREDKFWAPFRFQPGDDYEDRTNRWLHVLAKLKRNRSIEDARAEMKVIGSQLEREYPKENEGMGINVIYLRDEISKQSRFLLAGLVGASICLLLIACSNLANLLLARSMARRKELAVRTALGAGRERLIRQLLTESLVLAFLGAVFGVLLASALTPLLARLVPTTLPIAETPSLNLRILSFAAMAAMVTGIGFGVFPALKISNEKDSSGLSEGARAVGGHKERFRSVLIIAEVTASVVLLISSGLLLRALWRIQAIDPGFRTENVLTLRTWLPIPKYNETSKRAAFYQSVLSQTRALPGVKNAAYTSGLPLVMRGGVWDIEIQGRHFEPGQNRNASLRYITPGFFATLHIPILEGRDVADSDVQDKFMVAVVSKSFVERFWPGQNGLGKKFKVAFSERTIVGIAGDIRVRGLEQNSEPQVYLPYQQVPDGGIILYTPKDLVIHASNPLSLIPSVREIIRKADPDQPISDIQLLTDIVDGETAPRDTQLRVIGAFALAAIFLAAIGIHGLLSYAVSQRTQEFGVRIALGAQASEIFKLVMKQGVVLAIAGITLGLVLSFAAGKALEALLAGLKPFDPLTLITAVGLALVMTMIGSLLPATRAVRVDPTTALRNE